MTTEPKTAAVEETLRRLYVYNGGFLTQGRVRRILELSGYDISLGAPGEEDLIGVWGHSPTSPRGEAVARKTGAPILRVEDAFLRSVLPGRSGEPPLGLHLDGSGVHFDPEHVSDLERILRDAPLDDTALLNRARDGIALLKAAHLSKYNAFDPSLPAPKPGYVLVIDQTFGDASVKASSADRNTFLEMLFTAREEHPGARILIKTHPESQFGHREGYFTDAHVSEGVSFLTDAISPWHLLDGAIAVFTVSSQFGFEAILSGHKPVVFGQPFYMGWGLSDDRKPLDRRQRKLTRAQLFAAAMLLYPTWYDPYHDRLCSFEEAVATLEAETRAWREDHQGWIAAGMRLWKRAPLQKAFGSFKKVRFHEGAKAIKAAHATPMMVWASKAAPDLIAADAVRVEDGFLRSRGLGAALTPPLSLVLDDQGIYYDPGEPSRLEMLIEASVDLTLADRLRTERLIERIVEDGVSKYNLDAEDAPGVVPKGRRVLVPGQVEDDASVTLGTQEIRTNAALLQAARDANPQAVLLYKPHPDVEAGLRPGVVDDAESIADIVLNQTSATAALDLADEVWTMTSTMGFEALLRGKRVVCLGQPFYAGWGLTDDRSMPLPRRTALPDVVSLAYATLIAYPRYFDPITGRPCPPEVIVDRLAHGDVPEPAGANRWLSKLQGVFASYAHLWR